MQPLTVPLSRRLRGLVPAPRMGRPMDPFESFAAKYRLAEALGALANRDALTKAGWTLAILCAAYRDRFGELPRERILDFFAAELLTEDQATLVARGLETYVEVLGQLIESPSGEGAH